MKIAYFVNEDWEREYFISRFPEDPFNFIQGTTKDNPEFGDPEAEGVSVFVNSPFKAAEMDRFPALKLIATRSTGFDHIDMAEAHRRGITVSNVPTYGVHTVAEFAFALILALSRKIPEARRRVKEEGSFKQYDLRGFDLLGKTIGIIGTGHIGEYAIRMAKGFGMHVLAFDVFPKEGLAEKLGFEYVSFEDVLSRSDIITLHAPYNTHTHHMINRGNKHLIKRGAYLVNTSRGGLVESRALIEALDDGTLAGAGLDVLEGEAFMDDDSPVKRDDMDIATLQIALTNQYLVDHPNVIITPHVAFDTGEAIERILATTAENIKSFKNGNPVNIVT